MSSIKDLFEKNLKNFQSPFENAESASVGAESLEFVQAKQKEKRRYVPPLNFATASNFTKFGSAELYYTKAVERIHDTYPYDGSKKEKLQRQN